jgi:hypothetical protein
MLQRKLRYCGGEKEGSLLEGEQGSISRFQAFALQQWGKRPWHNRPK